MVDKERRPKAPIADILQGLSELLPQCEQEDIGNTSVPRETFEVYSTPEEGQRLIRFFVRIKQPELRAALIRIAAQMVAARD
jgi:hypothetical protein